MSKQFDFDFELIFQNQFDSAIIAASDVPDKSDEFQQLVQNEITKIKSVLDIYKGVNSMSSFFEHHDKRFKVTVRISKE
jgi:hypothetical protein